MDIKKQVLETMEKLYFKCAGDANYEHLYTLPSKWIDSLKYEIIGDEIYENFQMPSNKASTFPAEHSNDNEETLFKKKHP